VLASLLTLRSHFCSQTQPSTAVAVPQASLQLPTFETRTSVAHQPNRELFSTTHSNFHRACARTEGLCWTRLGRGQSWSSCITAQASAEARRESAPSNVFCHKTKKKALAATASAKNVTCWRHHTQMKFCKHLLTAISLSDPEVGGKIV
jgi:hypothetical protein